MILGAYKFQLLKTFPNMKSGLYRYFEVATPDSLLGSYFEKEDTKKIIFNFLKKASIFTYQKRMG